jgi:hypothetical protein
MTEITAFKANMHISLITAILDIAVIKDIMDITNTYIKKATLDNTDLKESR